MLRRIRDLAQALACLTLGRIALHQVSDAENGIERRPDFMAHVGQEGTFGPVGLLGEIFGQGKLAGPLANHGFKPALVVGQFAFAPPFFGDVVNEGEYMWNTIKIQHGGREFNIVRMAGAVEKYRLVINHSFHIL